MTVAWVLGSTGLLGSALSRSLHDAGFDLFCPSERLPWADGSSLEPAMLRAVQAFSARAKTAGPWQIYWAAGAGTMGSTVDELTGETQALHTLLRLLAADRRLMEADGAVALASSAGAIYAGSGDTVITEVTSVAPTTPYAAEKLRQENLLRDFTADPQRPRALVARISTLYGAGQASGKKQGLLSQIARSILRNRPVHIFVPFDTVRDYIEAQDAADRIVQALREPLTATRCQVRIIASERPVSIAEIIAIFKRIARKNPRIVTSAGRLSNLYARRMLFRSMVPWSATVRPPRRIALGIAQLLMSERTNYTAATTNPLRDGPQPPRTAVPLHRTEEVAP
jgi:UDP-glucose 4-epimerase